MERVIGVETIECPECGLHQKAEVTQNGVMPFATYIKICERCEYIILESDWKVVDDLAAVTRASTKVTNGKNSILQNPKRPP